MKKKLITFLFILVIQFSYTQVFYNKESNNLRYAGGMKPEVFEKLTQEEITILNECIGECGVKPEEVIWVTKEVYDKLDNPDYYSTKVVYKSTSNRKGNTNNYEGQNKLEKPQFMVFLDRCYGEFEVILQMYY